MTNRRSGATFIPTGPAPCNETRFRRSGGRPPIGKKAKPRLVAYFEGHEKGLVLNTTNCRVLEAVTGTDDPSEWGGAEVCAYNDPSVVFGGQEVGGIRMMRIRPDKPVPLSQPTSKSLDEANAEAATVGAGEEEAIPW